MQWEKIGKSRKGLRQLIARPCLGFGLADNIYKAPLGHWCRMENRRQASLNIVLKGTFSNEESPANAFKK